MSGCTAPCTELHIDIPTAEAGCLFKEVLRLAPPGSTVQSRCHLSDMVLESVFGEQEAGHGSHAYFPGEVPPLSSAARCRSL